jgi:hypothetical protein
MHDVFGMEVLNLFDMQNGDFYIGTIDDKGEPVKTPADKQDESDKTDLSDIQLEEVDLDAVSKESKEDTEETEAPPEE